MHFRYISAKIQPKNWKQHFDWGEEAGFTLAFTVAFYVRYLESVKVNSEKFGQGKNIRADFCSQTRL